MLVIKMPNNFVTDILIVVDGSGGGGKHSLSDYYELLIFLICDKILMESHHVKHM